MSDHGLRELADAMAEERKWRDTVGWFRSYHVQRLSALLASFGIDREPREHRVGAFGLERFIEKTLDRMVVELGSPFDDFIEAPESIVRLFQRHATPVRHAADGTYAACLSLLAEALVELHGIPADATVTDEDLRRHGFDPDRREPSLADLRLAEFED